MLSWGLGSDELLELGEDLLDGIEVRAVGWQEHQARSARFDRFPHAGHLVAAQVVGDDDIAGREGGREELLDIGTEAVSIDGAIEHQGRDDAIVP